MRIRYMVVTLTTMMLLAALQLCAVPAQAARAVVFGPPTEGAKITLSETSIDGPALFTRGASTGTEGGAATTVIAWTGTDAAHRLNFMTSSDGIHYGNLRTLSQTSIARPAVVQTAEGAGNTVITTWTGTDSLHHLNVLFGVYSNSFSKITLPDTSMTAPAMVIFKGDPLVAWAGSDANHSLNIIPVYARGGVFTGPKITLRQFHSLSRPSLWMDPNGGKLILSWTDLSTGQVKFATSTDSITWSGASTVAETSDTGPSMIGVPAGNQPAHWLAWRGTNPGHSLNVRYTESFPSWPLDNSKTILDETAFGGPALGYMGVNRQVLVAWAGTDSLHHLNVARIFVNA